MSSSKSTEDLGKKVVGFVDANFFVLGMISAVTAAGLFPGAGVDGSFVRPEKVIGDYGVALVFLLSGLSLRLTELRQAVMNVRLNLLVQATSMAAWPLLTYLALIPLRALPMINQKILDGLLVTSCLPTTINMCVMLTMNAGGNVASALANAVVGNFLGVFITPFLLFLTMRKAVTLSVAAVIKKLALKVLLPVAIGQALRLSKPLLTLQSNYKNSFKKASEITLLLIAWNAFCNSFSEGLGISLLDVLGLGLSLGLVHVVSLVALKEFFSSERLLGSLGITMTPKDAVASAFVASQKTLAMGLPLIKTVFTGSPDLAYFCAPIMLLHPAQLILGSALVPRWQRYIKENHDHGTAKEKEKDQQ